MLIWFLYQLVVSIPFKTLTCSRDAVVGWKLDFVGSHKAAVKANHKVFSDPLKSMSEEKNCFIFRFNTKCFTLAWEGSRNHIFRCEGHKLNPLKIDESLEMELLLLSFKHHFNIVSSL